MRIITARVCGEMKKNLWGQQNVIWGRAEITSYNVMASLYGSTAHSKEF